MIVIQYGVKKGRRVLSGNFTFQNVFAKQHNHRFGSTGSHWISISANLSKYFSEIIGTWVLFGLLSPTQLCSYFLHPSSLLLATPTPFCKGPVCRNLQVPEGGETWVENLLRRAERLCAPTCITLGDAPLYKSGPLGAGTAVSSRSQETEVAAYIFTAVGHWKAEMRAVRFWGGNEYPNQGCVGPAGWH